MKRNTLTTAVLAGLTGMAGMVSVSNAVNVNPDGLGQVLLFPYYTARGGNDTYISIVNTTDRGKAVKIRFIEALNSREVLDFNIYLSPFDVWTAAVTATDEGGGKMLTNDSTCTVPWFFGDDNFNGEIEFRDFQYNAAPVEALNFAGTIDGGPDGIERTASGYIEVIEMGTLAPLSDEDNPGEFDSTVADWVKHGSDRLPANCESVVDLWREAAPGSNPQPGDLGYWLGLDVNGNEVNSDSTWGFDTDIGASGGIFGAASIINVAEGTKFSYNATALDGFYMAGTTDHTDPGDLFPNLASGNGNESIVFDNGDLQVIDWSAFGLTHPLAVNATLTLAELMNEYTMEAGLGARTEWVLTFPTKGFHVDTAPGGNSLVEPGDDAIPPFSNVWTVDEPRSCDELTFRFWDREEQEPTVEPGQPGGVDVSPPPPPTAPPEVPTFQLCREANVIRLANDGSVPDATEILGEPLREEPFELLSYTNLSLPPAFESGWLRFDFSARESLAGDAVIGSNNAVRGLPVIGFGVTTISNGDLGDGVRANYGGTFQHRGSRQGFIAETGEPSP